MSVFGLKGLRGVNWLCQLTSWTCMTCVSSLKFSCFWYILLTWILVSNSRIFCLWLPLSSVKRSVWKNNIEELEYYCISTQHRIWSNNTREQIPIFILKHISTNIYSESFNLSFVMSVYRHKIPNASSFSYLPIDQQTFKYLVPVKGIPYGRSLGFSAMLFGAILGKRESCVQVCM